MLAAATSSPAATVAFRQPAAQGGRGLAALTQSIINTRNWIFPSPDLGLDQDHLVAERKHTTSQNWSIFAEC
jgi:hypothetical protein